MDLAVAIATAVAKAQARKHAETTWRLLAANTRRARARRRVMRFHSRIAAAATSSRPRRRIVATASLRQVRCRARRRQAFSTPSARRRHLDTFNRADNTLSFRRRAAHPAHALVNLFMALNIFSACRR